MNESIQYYFSKREEFDAAEREHYSRINSYNDEIGNIYSRLKINKIESELDKKLGEIIKQLGKNKGSAAKKREGITSAGVLNEIANQVNANPVSHFKNGSDIENLGDINKILQDINKIANSAEDLLKLTDKIEYITDNLNPEYLTALQSMGGSADISILSLGKDFYDKAISLIRWGSPKSIEQGKIMLKNRLADEIGNLGEGYGALLAKDTVEKMLKSFGIDIKDVQVKIRNSGEERLLDQISGDKITRVGDTTVAILYKNKNLFEFSLSHKMKGNYKPGVNVRKIGNIKLRSTTIGNIIKLIDQESYKDDIYNTYSFHYVHPSWGGKDPKTSEYGGFAFRKMWKGGRGKNSLMLRQLMAAYVLVNYLYGIPGQEQVLFLTVNQQIISMNKFAKYLQVASHSNGATLPYVSNIAYNQMLSKLEKFVGRDDVTENQVKDEINRFSATVNFYMHLDKMNAVMGSKNFF